MRLDDWFFQCHFTRDPVQPGCLGVDAVWQLLGFYCVWAGALGSGRALGSGEIEFFGQIRPHDRLVRYEIDVRRYSELEGRGLGDRDRRRPRARRRRADLHDQGARSPASSAASPTATYP